MKLYFDKEAMEAEVSKYVSPGMPIEEATRIMRDSGFKCKDSPFQTACVKCSVDVGIHHLFYVNQIHVLLYHEAGELTQFKTECFSIGP